MQVHSMSHRFRVCLLAMVCTLPSGCASVASLQDLHYSCCNKYRASEAWKCNFSRDQRKVCSQDFELGFKQGYYDTSMGKDCRLPPIAPPRYWSARYQSCSGQAAVQEWFRGYQYGITAAQSGSCPSFSEVPVSPGAPVLNKTGCGACYSPDRCNCQTEGCNDPGWAAPNIVHPDIYDEQAIPVEPEHQSHEAMLDLPSSRAIMPASFGGSVGIIGGYGIKKAD